MTLATLRHLERLSVWGVRFRSFTEAGPFGEAVVAILAAIAKQERIRLSELVMAGLARARVKGRVGGRRPLLGYRRAELVRRLGNAASRSLPSPSGVATGWPRSAPDGEVRA